MDAGCLIQDRGTYFFLNCSKPGLEEKYSCFMIRPVKFDGLDPKVQIVECVFGGRPDLDYWYIVNNSIRKAEGCKIQWYLNYIISLNGSMRHIKNWDEFTDYFMPITTPEEAMDFAIANTGDIPLFDLKDDPIVKNLLHEDKYIMERITLLNASIRPSYVEEFSNKSYIARLFGREMCGCSKHPRYAVDYIIHPDGLVEHYTGLKDKYTYNENGSIMFPWREEVYEGKYIKCVD